MASRPSLTAHPEREVSGIVESLQAAISDTTAPIWHDLPPEDIAAAERLLNEVIRRSRVVLAGS